MKMRIRRCVLFLLALVPIAAVSFSARAALMAGEVEREAPAGEDTGGAGSDGGSN
jgi:hypothetical protein